MIVDNNIVKYIGKVKELNIKYELDNNKDLNAGKIISPMQNFYNKSIFFKYENNNLCKAINNDDIYNITYKLQHVTVSNTSLGLKKSFNNIKNNTNSVKEKNLNNMHIYSKKIHKINEKILCSLEKIGFDKKHIIDSLINNNFNYATTSYYLLLNSQDTNNI